MYFMILPKHTAWSTFFKNRTGGWMLSDHISYVSLHLLLNSLEQIHYNCYHKFLYRSYNISLVFSNYVIIIFSHTEYLSSTEFYVSHCEPKIKKMES